jgi:hypothetical protein
MNMLRAGLAMVALSLGLQLILLIYASPLREIIADKCIPSWKPKE